MEAVYTVGEECKKCYSCVRICPTKAIEVHGGKAHIIPEKCVSCGYCVNVCSQNAKRIKSGVEDTLRLLEDDPDNTCAIIAPSFPAAFLEVEPEEVVGALRNTGFSAVYEVAFGADLVSYAYYEIFKNQDLSDPYKFYISTPCPAVVAFVERQFPDLVENLAPIVSPMEAMAKLIKEKINPEAAIVFIGPCVAKKDEAGRLGLVDSVLTFDELFELFENRGTDPARAEGAPFDPPLANLGRIYPVTGGLLKAAGIDADLIESPAAIIEGKDRVAEILQVLKGRKEAGKTFPYKLFDLLFCEGCIAGPVMHNDLTYYERKKYIINYMKKRPLISDLQEWKQCHKKYLEIDLSKQFSRLQVHMPMPTEEEIKKILAKTGKYTKEDELNCRACGYNSCREKAVAVWRGIAEVEMCLPYLISKLEKTISDLTENQAKLIQAEKLASMGQMAAGIAHEINNPLGVVLMYSHILKEELEPDHELTPDVDKVISEAERTRKIVRRILNFAREERIERAPADINSIVRTTAEQVTSYENGEQAEIVYELDEAIGEQNVDAAQLRQVFDNILRNAVEVMHEGGRITISSSDGEGDFTVVIKDQGPGIDEEKMSKLFSPFFTTKPVGKGTGLGLAVCYGIVKMHGGTIHAGNNPDGGAFFEIKIKKTFEEDSIVKDINSR